MSAFYFFVTKADVATRFMLALLIYGEVFAGVWLIKFYYDNATWFESIGRHIKGMPAIWMIQVVWNICDFIMGSSIYCFYRNSTDSLPVSGYIVDAITLLLLVKVAIAKLYPFVFVRLKYTMCSLIMIMVVCGISALMLILYACNARWEEFGYALPCLLWDIYLVYINFTWIRVERMKASGLL